MVIIPQHHSRRIAMIYPDWTSLPLLQRCCLASTSEVATQVEVKIPLPHSPLVEVEVIDESPLPYFNPPILDTLDFILQKVNVMDSDFVSSHHILMSMRSETSFISSPTFTMSSVQG